MRRLVFMAAMAAVTGCSSSTPSIVFEISSPGQLSSLRVMAKLYRDDGTVVLYPPREAAVGLASERASLLLEVPEEGRYAVHFVDVDAEGIVYAVTRCHEVRGVVEDLAVTLSAIGPDLDDDGDTFPEDAALYCAARADAGLDCDESCADSSYAALADCNPPPGYVAPAGCGEPSEDPAWNPFEPDICGDCFDQDCWGGDAPCVDGDGDGYPGGLDCDDRNDAINPGADEVCGNGIDENCRTELEGCVGGDLPCDDDGDSVVVLVSPGCGADCDDTSDVVFPGAEELCDDVLDNNCNGIVDEGCFPADTDRDGVPEDLDCNDCDSGVGPGMTDWCGDGIDEDCEGGDATCHVDDGDGDGVTGPAGDCDDADPRVHPGAADFCGDGEAQDCSAERVCGEVADVDGDRFGGLDDCDDENDAVNPWAAEVCDVAGVDDDCDGAINEVLDETGQTGCGWDDVAGQWYEIDYQAEVRHCGACGNDCRDDDVGDRCVEGRCTCGAGTTTCAGGVAAACCVDADGGSACVDLGSDTENCGYCGNRCHAGEVCVPTGPGGRGECLCEASGEACPPGDCWHCCGDDGCLDVCSDADRCGGCDVSCTSGDRPLGDICSGGLCQCGQVGEVCTGTQWCTDLTEGAAGCGCADLDTDPDNCGVCGHVCPDDGDDCTENNCVAGACEYPALDADDDGYCAPGCDDHGGDNECERDEDCDDSDPEVNDGARERCETPYDDDCDRDGETNDNGAIGCTTYMRDEDGDGYGLDFETRCTCVPESPYTETTGGDCDDDHAEANPSNSEDPCNGIDDDCDWSTSDGDLDCPGLCCGYPVACQECCSASDCDGANLCCGNTCYSGTCCTASDCGGGSWTCTASHTCSCSGRNCSGTCYLGATCCTSADCTDPLYPTCGPSFTCI